MKKVSTKALMPMLKPSDVNTREDKMQKTRDRELLKRRDKLSKGGEKKEKDLESLKSSKSLRN